jgi:putative Holliday junction resolvase
MPEPEPPRGILLAFDFGLRRIGVAVGQTETRTATALTTIRAGGDRRWAEIAGLIDEWRPCALVVGLPLDAEGRDTEISRAARNFGSRLRQRFSLPVFQVDERLSSRQAKARFAKLRAGGAARRKDAGRLDAMAAEIILENWLQSPPAGAAGCTDPD